MEAELSQMSTTPMGGAKKPNSIWIGVKMFLTDIGLTTSLGFIVGLFLGAARFSIEQVAQSPLIPIVGLVISMYLGYVLYRKSSEIPAIATLMGLGALWGGINIYVAMISSPSFNSTQQLIFLAAQMLVYITGWYVAKSTGLRLFVPKDIWFKVFSVIGGILVFVLLLGIVWVMNS